MEQYCTVHRYSCVMHIGSTVSGKIREDMDAVNAVDSILPAGTLSGAPKIRACEIIQELEGRKRGIYGGAVGYLDFTGNLDTCIGIRLAYKKNGKVCVQSGAGIVADSVPEKEYQECCNKAKAVVQAICEAFGGTVSYAKELMHGKSSMAQIKEASPLFQNIGTEMQVARYHSLAAIRNRC